MWEFILAREKELTFVHVNDDTMNIQILIFLFHIIEKEKYHTHSLLIRYKFQIN